MTPGQYVLWGFVALAGAAAVGFLVAMIGQVAGIGHAPGYVVGALIASVGVGLLMIAIVGYGVRAGRR